MMDGLRSLYNYYFPSSDQRISKEVDTRAKEVDTRPKEVDTRAKDVDIRTKVLKMMQAHLRQKYEDWDKKLEEEGFSLIFGEMSPEVLEWNKQRNERAISDVSQYVLNFKEVTHLTPAALKALCSESEREWSAFLSAEKSHRGVLDLDQMEAATEMSEDEFNRFFVQATCIGMTLAYFKEFHRTGKMDSSFFCPLHLVNCETKQGVKISRLDYTKMDKAEIEKKTKPARFLQAAFKLSLQMNSYQSSELVPDQVMRNQGCELIRMYPQPGENKSSTYPIEDLVPVLKEVSDEQTFNSYYVLRIYSHKTRGAHAIGLHPRAPFHFMDMKHGIESCDTIDDLVLLLSTFLMDKYLSFNQFLIEEFIIPAAPRA